MPVVRRLKVKADHFPAGMRIRTAGKRPVKLLVGSPAGFGEHLLRRGRQNDWDVALTTVTMDCLRRGNPRSDGIHLEVARNANARRSCAPLAPGKKLGTQVALGVRHDCAKTTDCPLGVRLGDLQLFSSDV